MVDNPRASTPVVPVVGAVVGAIVIAALLVVGGMYLEATVRAGATTNPDSPVDADWLAAKNAQLSG